MQWHVSAVAIGAALLATAVPTNASQDFTAKSAAAAIITSLGAAKLEIERRVGARKAVAGVGAGIVLPTLTDRERIYALEFGHVTSSGTLIGYNTKYGVVVVLEPKYEGEQVKWSCKVLPLTAAPMLCR